MKHLTSKAIRDGMGGVGGIASMRSLDAVDRIESKLSAPKDTLVQMHV